MSSQVFFNRPSFILVILLIAGLIFSYNLTGWLIEDDEGIYEYIAWRISEGDILYRDVLSQKPPLILYLGAIIFKVVGYSVFALRFASVLMALGTALIIYIIGFRLHNHPTGLIAAILFLLNPIIVWQARYYRPDIYLLFFTYTSLFFFWYSWQHHRYRLAILSGTLFGLAALSKLTGPFMIIPLAFFYVWAIRPNSQIIRSRLDRHILLWIIGLSIPVIIILTYEAYGGGFISQTFGYQIQSSRQLSIYNMLLQNARQILIFLIYNLFLTLPALVYFKIYKPLRSPNSGHILLSTAILALLPFLIITRDIWLRHFILVLPALILMAAAVIVHLADIFSRSKLIIFTWILAVIIVFWLPLYYYPDPRAIITSKETDTVKLVQLITRQTDSSDYIFSDYAALNFHARRLGPPRLTSMISSQSTPSGQISAADIVNQLEKYQVKLVLKHIKGGSIKPHHLTNLKNPQVLTNYLEKQYQMTGTQDRAGQIFAIYQRRLE